MSILQFNKAFVILHTGPATYEQRVLATQPDNLLAYWPLNEDVGAGSVVDATGNGYDGTPSNVTFGVTGIGDDNTAARFDGVNGTTINIYSAGLASAVNGSLGTLMVWFKMGTGVLTDGTERHLFRMGENAANNLVRAYKLTTNNTMRIRHVGNGTLKDKSFTVSTTDWYCLITTWTVAGNALDVYLDGVVQGVPTTGLVAWSSQGTGYAIGSEYNGNVVTEGDIAHVALWDTVLSPAEILTLSSVAI